MATFSRFADVEWTGGTIDGSGSVFSGSGAYAVPVTFPSVRGEDAGKTTPEEMLAASHAICYAIGLRSVIGRRGGSAKIVRVRATVTAEKGPGGIRIQSSHLKAIVEGLQGIDAATLNQIAETVERECTISVAIAGNVAISFEVEVR